MGTTAPSDGASLPSSTAAAAPVPVPVPAASSSAATIPSPNASVGSSHSEHDHPQHVLILYASETGNAQDMAERVARAFRAAHRRAITLSMDEYDVKDLPHESLIVFITSTHGRGDPPPAMRKLWNRLIRKGLPHDILEDVHYTIYGLGDTSYERFCFAGKMLARRLDHLGANLLCEPAWGDERAPDGYEESFLPWLQRTLNAIVPYLPGPSTPPLLNTALPPPIYALDPAPPETEFSGLSVNEETNGTAQSNGTSSTPSAVHAPKGWKWATLTRSRRVTAKGWWQDVRELELTLDDSTPYPAGSVAVLHPRCSDEEVITFLEMNGLEEVADRRIIVRSTLPNQPLPPHIPSGPTTLRILLTHHLDLRCSPRKSFFEWLRRFSNDEREQERLDEFIADPDEVHDYATRPSRTVLETLADFRLTKIPLEYVLEVLSPLRRRQFSIASDSQAHPGKIQLLIALVEYKTNLSIPRVGLCSSWLPTLPEGTRVPYEILPPTLFLPTPDTPVILVGPGTGVAPMRAFLEARVAQGAASGTALYFGCRSVKQDLYFADDWEAHRAAGATVRIAPSRDGENKVYVQDLLRKDAKMVNDWIVHRRGHIYVCGSSNAMPREVRAAVAWCISTAGAGTLSEEESEAYVETMFDDGRGGEESW